MLLRCKNGIHVNREFAEIVPSGGAVFMLRSRKESGWQLDFRVSLDKTKQT